MKIVSTILLALCSLTMYAQTAADYAIQLTASTQVTPPSITIKWKKVNFGTPTYYVYRKTITAPNWGTGLATITTGDTTFTDNTVVADSAYEYYVTAGGTGMAPSPSGYIFAGIKAAPIHNRGTLILVVDTAFTDSCATELTTLMKDINGDGWQIVRHDIPRTAPDTVVKAAIRADYNSIPDVKAVLLVGHIAVPYSGEINPDAHTDHLGAWPCDAYYGSMTGVWTDVAINNISSANPLNRNTPGDGKWDQSSLPAPVNLQVSRIDMWNMPAFGATEATMMRRYLQKAHTYKMDSLTMRHRAIVSDNFGAFSGEAFAANAWRNFTPLVGRDSIRSLPLIASLADSSFQWVYGCGGGSYTSAGGIGNTSDFASAGAVHGIFTLMFGSYFGDWNYANSFLRAPLCADTPALTACWAGRPNWFFHHMALGHNIGFSTKLTQNNVTPTAWYQPQNYGAGWAHVALLGDLTLRTDYVIPVSDVSATPVAFSGATITWSASPDAAVTGYYVYRADSLFGHYARISPMVAGVSFSDTVGVNGLKYYMVRPVKLENTPSGGYYNLGIGVTDTATVTYPVPVSVQAVAASVDRVVVYPNPASSYIDVAISCTSETEADIYLMNISGQRFFPIRKGLSVGEQRYRADVSTLPAGNYLLYVQTATGVHTVKWTKL
jgi:hypothetical protein